MRVDAEVELGLGCGGGIVLVAFEARRGSLERGCLEAFVVVVVLLLLSSLPSVVGCPCARAGVGAGAAVPGLRCGG